MTIFPRIITKQPKYTTIKQPIHIAEICLHIAEIPSLSNIFPGSGHIQSRMLKALLLLQFFKYLSIN